MLYYNHQGGNKKRIPLIGQRREPDSRLASPKSTKKGLLKMTTAELILRSNKKYPNKAALAAIIFLNSMALN